MATQLHIQDSRHDFQEKPGSMGMVFICQYCDLKGRRPYADTSFLYIESANTPKVENCTADNPKFTRPKVIRITQVDYTRVNMRSLKPQTLHDVLPKPDYVNNRYLNNVWVLGDKNKVVMLLPGEYSIIQPSKINNP